MFVAIESPKIAVEAVSVFDSLAMLRPLSAQAISRLLALCWSFSFTALPR